MLYVSLGGILLGIILGALFYPKFALYSGIEFPSKVDLDPPGPVGAVRVRSVDVQKPLPNFNATLTNATRSWTIDPLQNNSSVEGFRFLDRDRSQTLSVGDLFEIPSGAGHGYYQLRIFWKSRSDPVGYLTWTQ